MRTKKVKPPPKEFEYILNITKNFDEVKKKEYISFRFSTTKEFLTFQYILKIENKFEGDRIYFNILGFTAPLGDLSNYGHAGYEYRMYDFKPGDYSVSIDKRDSEISKFKLTIVKSDKDPVKITHVPKITFIQIKSDYDS